MRRILALAGLVAAVAAPAVAQVNNTGGSGWTVNVYTVATATNSGFYSAFNPAGGEPGVWQANNASTEWISAWDDFSTTPGAGDYDRTTDANARYIYTFRYTFAQPLVAGYVGFAAGWDNILKTISSGGPNPTSGVPSDFLIAAFAPERDVDSYFGICRTEDGMHDTGDADCSAFFVVEIGQATAWMEFEIWGDGQTDGLWLEWDRKLMPAEVIPEPATMTLLATGLAAMGGASIRRRRRRQRHDD